MRPHLQSLMSIYSLWLTLTRQRWACRLMEIQGLKFLIGRFALKNFNQ